MRGICEIPMCQQCAKKIMQENVGAFFALLDICGTHFHEKYFPWASYKEEDYLQTDCINYLESNGYIKTLDDPIQADQVRLIPVYKDSLNARMYCCERHFS
jgi:hypothetical protein